MTPKSSTVLAALALLFLSACSTPNTKDDEKKPTDQPSHPTYSLPVPEQTMLLVRVDPKRSVAMLESTEAVAEAGRMGAPPKVAQPGRLAVSALLEGRVDVRRALSNAGKVDASFLPTLADDRAMVMAVSARGNEALLETMNYATPAPPSVLPWGLSVRAFLPAADPAQLQGQIEAHCEAAKRACPTLVRTAHTESHAVIDVHFDPLRSARQKYAPDSIPEVDWAASDAGFWKRDTPALRAFVEDKAAVSIYWRSDDLPQLAAYAGASETLSAIEMATPENRMLMLARGYALAGMSYLFRSPEARENDDITLSFDADETGGFVAEAYQTYTKRGAEVAEAATTSVRLPAINLDNAVIEFESSHDIAAAMSAAKAPLWMPTSGGQGGRNSFVTLMRNSGSWGYTIPMASYPVSFQKGLLNSGVGVPNRLMTQLKDVLAVRAKLDLVSSSRSKLGFAPRGAISVALPRDSSTPAMFGMAVQSLQSQYGFQATVDTQTTAEHKIVTAVFGKADGVLGEMAPVSSTVSAHVALDRLAARLELESLKKVGGQAPPEIIAALKHLKAVQIERPSAKFGAATRLHVGAGRVDTLVVPAVDMTLTRPMASESECLRRGIGVSREGLDAMDMGAPSKRLDFALEIASQLEEIEKTCESDKETLEWMRAAWSANAAELYVERLRYNKASELMTAACEAGYEHACERQEAIEAFAAKGRYPSVNKPMIELSSVPGDYRVLTIDGLERWKQPFLGAATNGPDLSVAQLRDAARNASPNKRPRSIERLPFHITDEIDGTVRSVVFLPVDRRVSSEVIASVVTLAENQRVDERVMRQRQILNKPRPADRAFSGIFFPVQASKGEGTAGVYLTTAPSKASNSAKVVIGAKGITLEYKGKTSKLAAEDADRLAELVKKATDEGKSETFAELNEAYRVNVIGDALAKLNVGLPQAAEIVVEEPVPFGMLASVVNELGTTMTKSGTVPRIQLVVGDE